MARKHNIKINKINIPVNIEEGIYKDKPRRSYC